MTAADRPIPNRSRPVGALESRLQKFVEEARAAVDAAKPGPERDALMQKLNEARTFSSGGAPTKRVDPANLVR